MKKPKTARETIEAIREQHEAFEALIGGLTPEQMTAAGVSGDWSIKDIAAHLTAWQQRLLVILDAVRAGTEPVIPTTVPNVQDTDAANAEHYERNRDRTFHDVLHDLRETHRLVIDGLSPLTDGDLFAPDRLPWRKGRPLITVVAGETYDHYPEHLSAIREWLARQ
jgi:hypothetical protein